MPPKQHAPKVFPTTHWSELERVGEGERASIQGALDRLLTQYLPPLKHFLIRGYGCSPDTADELLQGFVLDRIIQGRLIAKADQQRGRFRTLLITALKNYVSNVHRRERRSGMMLPLANDYAEPASTSNDPHTIFEIAWAKELVTEALRRMEDWCRDSNRMDVWAVFHLQVVQPIYSNTRRPSYKDIGNRSPQLAIQVVMIR